MTDVKESGSYDNYLDKKVRLDDDYRATLDKHFDEYLDLPIADQTKAKRKKWQEDAFKVLYVHFKTLDDYADFCGLLNEIIPYKTRDMYYPLHDPETQLFEIEKPKINIDKKLLKPAKSEGSIAFDLDVETEETKWKEHWIDMPEFAHSYDIKFKSLHIYFRKEEHFEQFKEAIGQKPNDKTKAIWHPKPNREPNALWRWYEESDLPEDNISTDKPVEFAE